jgi:hypothetical protein
MSNQKKPHGWKEETSKSILMKSDGSLAGVDFAMQVINFDALVDNLFKDLKKIKVSKFWVY